MVVGVFFRRGGSSCARSSSWSRVGAGTGTRTGTGTARSSGLQQCRPRRCFHAKGKGNVEANAEVAAETSASSSMSFGKIAGFAAFVLGGGGATLGYMMTSDEEFLFTVNDSYPWLVNFMAPMIGLPVTVEGDAFDPDAFGPRTIDGVVGEELKVVVRLMSGRTLVLDVASDATQASVKDRLRFETDDASEEIAEIIFVDAADASKSTEEIAALYFPGVTLPTIPPNAGEKELVQVLLKCEAMSVDLKVQRELAAKYGGNKQDLDRALVSLDQVAKTAQRMLGIDEEKEKKKSSSWFW